MSALSELTNIELKLGGIPIASRGATIYLLQKSMMIRNTFSRKCQYAPAFDEHVVIWVMIVTQITGGKMAS